MKINYTKLKELNLEAVLPNGDFMSCYFLIQNGVERYLSGEIITDECKKFLIDVGVLEILTEERKNIVEPFNFMGNDRSQSN